MSPCLLVYNVYFYYDTRLTVDILAVIYRQ